MNGQTYVDSSNRQILRVSGRYAATARSKSIAMFLAFDPPTNVATTRLGSTCHRPMLGQSAITVFATRSAASNTGNRARKEAILMTCVTIRLCSERCRPYDSTRPPQSTRSSRNEQVRTLGKGGPIRRLLWPVGHNCVALLRFLCFIHFHASRSCVLLIHLCLFPSFSLLHNCHSPP